MVAMEIPIVIMTTATYFDLGYLEQREREREREREDREEREIINM